MINNQKHRGRRKIWETREIRGSVALFSVAWATLVLRVSADCRRGRGHNEVPIRNIIDVVRGELKAEDSLAAVESVGELFKENGRTVDARPHGAAGVLIKPTRRTVCWKDDERDFS